MRDDWWYLVDPIFERCFEGADQLERGVRDNDGDAGSAVEVRAQFRGVDAGPVLPGAERPVVGDLVGVAGPPNSPPSRLRGG
ncbi:hypothetical protein [Amycolatopsis sp. NPDC001319]|uniref:hypothetical protein n=1 Tax=unclassified Amycolatopsis TaxID=2618356 RepID=UPI0036A2B579